MILFAFAVPGRFGQWCDAIIARLGERALGSLLAIAASGPDDMAVDLIRSEGAHFMIKGPQPGPWLHRVLRETEKPFTIALNDPRDAAFDLIFRHGLEMSDAVRRVGNSCASMMSCVSLPGALVLNASRDWQRPAITAEMIARHFGLDIDRAAIGNVVEEVAGSGLGPETEPPEWGFDPRATAVAEIVGGAITPYVDHFLGAPFAPITWARELVMADGHIPAAHAVDVTGRVRALLYGPYISIPPGNWTAEVVLGFSHEATDVNFVVDILAAGKQLCATSIQPAHEGIYSVNLSFVIDEGNAHPLEFRVVNEKPVFDGRLALGRITLTLQHNSPHLGEPLREELGLAN
jgi:hypothetical protein